MPPEKLLKKSEKSFKKPENLEQLTAQAEQIVFRRSFGNNAVDQIAALVINSTYSAVLELIANSYDADATRVRVDIDFGNDCLMISDDGEGMTPLDLVAFYRLGDSPKLTEPVSPKGRRRIGKFGFATILLKFLCDEYVLETTKNGVCTKVDERFASVLAQDDIIPYSLSSIPSKAHGTTITMRGLHFEEGLSFETRKLLRSIQWELPLLPDFRVYFNNTLVESKSILNSREFRIDERGKYMGVVKGSIYLTRVVSSMAGMHIYVNGRRVGSPRELMNSQRFSRMFNDNLVGIIEANELEGAILFDRGRFRSDHPGYVELQKTLAKAINAVRRYVESEAGHSAAAKAEKSINSLLLKVKDKLIAAKISGITKDTVIQFSDALNESQIGLYICNAPDNAAPDASHADNAAADNNVIYFNKNAPSLVVGNSFNQHYYFGLLLSAVVDTIALAASERASLSEFMKNRNDIWSRLNVVAKAPPKELHANAVYSFGELSQYSGISLPVLNYMARGGMFDGVASAGVDAEVLGKDFVDVLKRTNGLVSLYDVILELGNDRVQTTSWNRFNNALGQADPFMSPFVVDLSKPGYEPCFFVESSCKRQVMELFQSKYFDLRTVAYDPKKGFQLFGGSFYSIPSIAELCSTSVDGVAAVIDYASKNKLVIPQARVGRGFVFQYKGFISALQSMRHSNHGRH